MVLYPLLPITASVGTLPGTGKVALRASLGTLPGTGKVALRASLGTLPGTGSVALRASLGTLPGTGKVALRASLGTLPGTGKVALSKGLGGGLGFSVNGKKVTISSFRVKTGDVVSLKEKNEDLKIITEHIAAGSGIGVPTFLEADPKNRKITIEALPASEDVPIEVSERAVVEFYSK